MTAEGEAVEKRRADKARRLREASGLMNAAADELERLEAASGLLTRASELIKDISPAHVICKSLRLDADLLQMIAQNLQPMKGSA